LGVHSGGHRPIAANVPSVYVEPRRPTRLLMRRPTEWVKEASPARLDAFGPAPRAELTHLLTLPDLERAERIGEFWVTRRTAPFTGLSHLLSSLAPREEGYMQG